MWVACEWKQLCETIFEQFEDVLQYKAEVAVKV
jgi:hypothetical protein